MPSSVSKRWKRPDEDPLEVLPHERFERATLQPGALKSYGQLLYHPMAPNQPPYPVVLFTSLKQMNQPARVKDRLYHEIVYRIAWSYRLDSRTVEQDLDRALQHHSRQNFRRALAEGGVRALEDG